MWKSVMASKHYSKSFSYLKRVAIKKSGGKGSFSFVETENVPLIYIPEVYKLIMDADGNTNTSTAEAIIPSKFFTDNILTPSINDRLIDNSGTKYRIISIEDFTTQAHSKVYHVYLRRDEIAI